MANLHKVLLIFQEKIVMLSIRELYNDNEFPLLLNEVDMNPLNVMNNLNC